MLQQPSAATYVAMIKPAGSRCNLQCSYCYYLGTDGLLGSPSVPCMSDMALESVVRAHIAASPGPTIPFIWHGGEPTLAGLPFYRRAVELQKKYLPAGRSAWNNLQTNGLLLSDEWCRFLAEEKFDVGLSIDGAQWLHDRYRRDAAGQGSYDRVCEAAQRLMRHGVKPDLLCTVTSDAAAAPLDVYRPLRDMGTGWIQFIPIVRRDEGGAVTADSVTPEGYGRFLTDVFNEWIAQDVGRCGVQLFAETALVLGGGQASLCWMAPVCGRAPVVEKDGSLYSCDHFVDAAHRLGSFIEDDPRALIDSSAQTAFGKAKRDSLTSQCRACRYLPLCNGACPKDRFALSEDGETGQYYLCKGLLAFFRRAAEPLGRFAELMRKGARPETIMADIREREIAKWRKVGRNDPCPCGSGRKAKECCLNRRRI